MLPCSSVSSVAKTKDFTVVDKGAPNKAATSSQVLLPGVGVRAWGLAASGRACAGANASAFSMLAA